MKISHRSIPMPSLTRPTGNANFLTFRLGGVTLAYSYETLIGIQASPSADWVVRTNQWGPTTGKHLAHLDGGSPEAKADRLDTVAFLDAVSEVVA